MIGQNTFRFHKFTEEEKKPDRYGNSYSKDFFSSNLLSTRQKSRPFQNRQSSSQDYISKNFNSKSYQFKNSNNIPSLTSRNFNKNNLIYSDNNISVSSNFPLGKILNTDFDFILKKGDTTIIDQFLPQMIYNDLSFSDNNHLQLILRKFQNVLEFLFTEQNKLLNNNNQIEELFNNQNSNLNKKLRQLEQDEYKTNNLLNVNHSQISRLVKKIKAYKSILKSTGNEKLIPNITLMKIESKGGYYYCEICPDKTFKTYEEIHIHYIKEHFKSFNNKNMIYNSNNLNKKYFENQLNMFKTELKKELLNINKEYDDMENNKKYLDLKSNINLSGVNRSNKFMNSQTLRNKMHSSNNLGDYRNISSFPNNEIYGQLNRLEFEQEKQFKRMTEDFNKLKLEIFNEIKNLGVNQPVILKDNINENDNNQNNYNEKNTNIHIDINQNNNKINNNDDNNEKIKNGKGKKYITQSQEINEESGENDISYTPGAGLKESSINHSISYNPYTKDDKNNDKEKEKSQMGESINNNNDKEKEKSQMGESINNNNDKEKEKEKEKSQMGESINNNNDKIKQKSQFGESLNNNNKLFKSSIIQNPTENEMKYSFINRIKQIGPNIIKSSSDLNYIFDPDRNKEKAKEIEEIIKEREQKYIKDENDYKQIIYNIMKDNKNKFQYEPKFIKYYNKIIEGYNIPELKNINLEYLKKDEEIKNKEEEEKDTKYKKEKEDDGFNLDFGDIIGRNSIKGTILKESRVKKSNDTYDPIEKLVDKRKNLEEDI